VQENRERWKELAELAANEQDPKKLIALIQEINQLLAEKEKRLTLPTRAPLVTHRQWENTSRRCLKYCVAG
jgi:hypothetical protein